MSDVPTVNVLIPTPLRRFTGGEGRIRAAGNTVGGVLDAIEAQFPGFGERVREEHGEIRRFVNVFVNGVNVRDREGAATTLAAGDEVGIIPAMAGGRRRRFA